MGFDWGEFIDLAEYLGQFNPRGTPGFTKQAMHRAGVSRAYFGAFGLLRRWAETQGFQAQRDANDHLELVRFLQAHGFNAVAGRLIDLRRSRNRCDYDDTVPGLDYLSSAAVQEARWLSAFARTNGSS
ncbi:hypothetical protein U7230_07365 [Carboxydochorda subterranea]|uniref:Uncharacterized protein n=1 Tax=Carboxydichorda subterranea TaxID=3109565 RepID=A0ABZ1C3X6_9FIRM|nr:hypothetical protein [Limnochorda sp. L945t]WRP18802.1 hypothetical protein U7230_07365 [Limnochorda sp. L945t]